MDNFIRRKFVVRVAVKALVAALIAMETLGVIKEGAYADMVLVDGNPLEDLDLVIDPENNFVVIMKDGKIYKNTL